MPSCAPANCGNRRQTRPVTPESENESNNESYTESFFSFLDEQILVSWILMGIHAFPYLSDSDNGLESSSFNEYQRPALHPQTKPSTPASPHRPILPIHLGVQQTMSSTSSLPALPPRRNSETRSSLP